jgi:hypothetical protein
MKKVEGSDSPLELERRLKQGVDQLREATETLEDLVHLADAIGPLVGVKRTGRGRGASRPAAESRTQQGYGTAAPPRGGRTQGPAGGAPPAPAETEEIPEWRKVFPALSAEVPHKKNKGGS